MDIVIKLSQFLLSLSLLIILHELGHFIPAKLFKTRVEKFYLFFDVKFSLLKKKIGETEYGIGWLPLGGYVKISGMIDESMDKEQMALPPEPWEFRSKPAWQRLIIMLGGVTVNFILAFVIYIGMAYAYGEMFIANKDLKDGLLIENKAMLNAGFKTGDIIVGIDGEKVIRYDSDVNRKLATSKEVVIDRNGTEQTIAIPNDFVDQYSKAGKDALATFRVPFVIGKIADDSKNTVLKPKDILLSLNGQKVKYLDEAKTILENNKGKTVEATLLRNQKEEKVKLMVANDGKLGIQLAGLDLDSLEKLGYYKISKREFSFLESIPVGIERGKDQLVGYGKQLKLIFNPETKAYKQVGGFAAIFNVFPKTWSWEAFWSITALLSIMLGVMNLLPIPALDGGHVMFLLYEIISGRKPSDKFLENAQMVGFVLLISLLLFANGNDIYKAIVGK
ncbi:RIP metalloprotease RseP [Flavobacterium sp. Fl-318]|uniref:Zinc metalloprotease n=1 Tax=Flavobacterium cupriresistens TaxID=2893885 RepID=A0ABU4RDD7_9FLAO|nr:MULTISPECIES: RIP metalloprotease RseP [unclassified Flavobacterium]MDX6190597.1 RIP metalloprotease RseP [Flavobacterium sp. Fl-318]UFH43657.1 RIP metalloprotease RseP [Flavobacterium sp. F-323]